MKRAHAVVVLGAEIVIEAETDAAPVRAADADVKAFLLFLAEHRNEGDATIRMLVTTWLAALPTPRRLAVVRAVVGGRAAALRDVARVVH